MDWLYIKNYTCWLIVHLTHWSLYIGNLASMVMVIIYCEWYIALPIMTFLGHPIVGGMHCAYNNIENRYRDKLGWALIEHDFLPTAMDTLFNKLRKKNKDA